MKTTTMILSGLLACMISLPATAASRDVERKAKEIAASEFPDDYRTQKYEVRRQMEAYDAIEKMTPPYNVPYSVFYQLKSDAQKRFPNDYRTQKYEIKSQMKSYQALH